jgi:hypothetical protein
MVIGTLFIRHFETNKELIRTTFNMTPYVKCKAKLINLRISLLRNTLVNIE